MANVCSYGIINGRGFTTEEKQRLVATSFACSLSVRDFAAQEGIGYSTLNKWRRQYGKLTDTGPGFVPVAVMDSQEVPDQAEHREEASPSVPVREEEPSQIIINLSNGRRLEVRETIPPRTLKHLLSVLEAS